MALYESNYRRLGWLLPDLRHIEGPQVSRVDDDLPLHLDVLELTRHTSTVRLTYWFDEPGGKVADPDLTVRIYHDARLAEAMACIPRHRHVALKDFHTDPGAELSRRWARNTMLNKWLEYAADHGHRFSQTAEPAITP